jgi:2-polyprenyl-6-methoxyphenol hydroxylase-like FAD-dependent oxidoreductase
MNSKQIVQSNKHAVVIGASMTGLVAARVLSDHFEQVPIIERDRLPEQVEVRKGVPQGQHVHALLAKGAVILAELFPGLFEALTRQGAIRFTPQDIRSYTMGTWNTRFPSTIHIYSQSRHFEQREPMSNQMKSTTDLHIRLPAGRFLVYTEYEDPAGRALQLFHGFPGSRCITITWAC